jgi:phosphatidylinositol-3,4,5-trisphosphate 3-phosphatase/dual-specificity protein phosphatase PTEN
LQIDAGGDWHFLLMDFLREIVGGPKNRFKEHGYNLDLTYITERIVAMAFPASGL